MPKCINKLLKMVEPDFFYLNHQPSKELVIPLNKKLLSLCFALLVYATIEAQIEG